jgi:glycosyltransferase involved in cell wall biosynthesis
MLDLNDFPLDKIQIFPPQENLTEFYRIADLVILPSTKEGLGYTMLEAGLNTIPFIGSNTGGIAEFIEDGVNGYLFPPGNSIELAEKTKFVLENPEAASISGSKLNEKVLRLCNCKEYFQKLTNIYHKLIANS